MVPPIRLTGGIEGASKGRNYHNHLQSMPTQVLRLDTLVCLSDRQYGEICLAYSTRDTVDLPSLSDPTVCPRKCALLASFITFCIGLLIPAVPDVHQLLASPFSSRTRARPNCWAGCYFPPYCMYTIRRYIRRYFSLIRSTRGPVRTARQHPTLIALIPAFHPSFPPHHPFASDSRTSCHTIYDLGSTALQAQDNLVSCCRPFPPSRVRRAPSPSRLKYYSKWARQHILILIAYHIFLPKPKSRRCKTAKPSR